jgi:hypothetical protein
MRAGQLIRHPAASVLCSSVCCCTPPSSLASRRPDLIAYYSDVVLLGMITAQAFVYFSRYQK